MSGPGHSTRVLLGSGGISTEERKATYRELVTEHFLDAHIVFVRSLRRTRQYTSRMQDFSVHLVRGSLGYRISRRRFRNTRSRWNIRRWRQLVPSTRELHDNGLVTPIRDRVLSGVPYLGVSAGSNVACPTMMTTNDMPIVLPPSFQSSASSPSKSTRTTIQEISFYDGDRLKHTGESRSQRISEFHRIHDTPVLGMWEGSFIHWDGEGAD